MERKTLENNKESRDHAVLVGLRSPVLGEDSADEESLMELSELVDTAGGDTAALRTSLTEFPGIGPTGADIFLREAQSVWPDVRPYADRRTLAGAKRLGLPASPGDLVGLVGEADFGRLASALVRVALGEESAGEVSRSAATAR